MTNWQPQPSWERPLTGPGVVLGPMTLADVLDGSFKLLSKNRKSIGIAVLVYSIPIAIISVIAGTLLSSGGHVGGTSGLFVTADQTNGASIVAGLSLILIQFVYYVVAFPLLSATIARVAAASYFGRELPLDQAFRGIRKMWPTLIGASLLTGLCTFAGFCACVLPAIAVANLLSIVNSVVAVEEISAIDSLHRSWKLVWPRFWPYLGTWILAIMVASFVGFLIAIVPSILGVICNALGVPFLYWIFISIGSVLRSIVVLPFIGIVSLLLYFDARIRTEGFDVQMMSAALEHPQASGPNPTHP